MQDSSSIASIAEEDTSQCDGDSDAAVAGDDASSSSTDGQRELPKKSVKDHFRRFGRKVVLPFLDQVVGDQNEESGETLNDMEVSTVAVSD